MTIEISPTNVTAVQLADGWHEIRPGSFKIEEYRYGGPGSLLAMLNQDNGPGFTFTEPAGHNVSGPITSVVAVRH